ncbi:hypothetical protein NW733_05080 [Mycoplasmopsis felis]|uniref:hypothetical protein n=1 Tax=Mycoplasmopsis felis TaxID=33923 RepID=UPI0021E073FE|nr:hypothetical protein [Mycoplasmopsis felis]MCU9932006.1 hypothetical protein [Mycoplasmopsis felis]
MRSNIKTLSFLIELFNNSFEIKSIMLLPFSIPNKSKSFAWLTSISSSASGVFLDSLP